MNISIVIPVLDERESLPPLIDAIMAVSSHHALALEEIILVDDGSTDGSWDVMRDLAESHSAVRALKLRRNFGKAAALDAGIRAARGEILITMDADLQDDPEELPRFVASIEEGHDLVSGWKKNRNDPLSKTLPSKLFNGVTAAISGVPLNDFNCGFKAYRRTVFDEIDLYGDLHRYIPVLAHFSGFRIGEIEVRHHPRKFGRTKYGIQRFVRGYLDLLTVMTITRYSHRPGHLFGGVGTAFSGAGLLVLLYLTGLKIFAAAQIGTRPLLFLGILLVIVGFQFILFGMLAELINARTQKQRPPQLVTQRIGFKENS